MRITETGNPTGMSRSAGSPHPVASSPPSATGQSTSNSTPVSLVERLSILFGEIRVDITSAQVQNLASALSEIGLSPSDIDTGIALRALFLHRNSVHLSPALLRGDSFTGGHAIIPQVVSFLDEALGFLGSGDITGASRAVLETLVHDIEALFRTENPAAMMGNIPENILRMTGMTFEWRLLAWYRGGRNHEMLQNLMRGNLKGILLSFLEHIGKDSIRGSMIRNMETRARTLLDLISARQVTHLLDNSGERRTLFLSIPFGEPGERVYAGIRADGRKRREDDVSGSEQFSLALDIETTKLGSVRAHIRFSGKMTAVTFLLNDREALAIAEEMGEEFRDMLRRRGYEPGVVRFALAESDDTYGENQIHRRNTLDIQG